MLKILLLVFIIINLFVNHARSVIVENINVIGNERISKDTIILFGNIDKNLDFNENRINQILKDLYETGFFENISINISNKKMFIKVEENPIIQTLYIEGVKNKKIKGKIKELTKLKDKSSLNLVDIKSDKILISNFLKNLGYFFTEISVDIVELENRFVNLYYNINLNEKSKISKIKFLGDKVFKAGKLKNLIISEEYRFWKI